jgi:hypothetical protein
VAQERVTGEDRHRLTSVLVQGRSSAAEVVVIQRGQVVVGKAKAVDQFNRGTRRQALGTIPASGDAGVPGQQRAESFPAVEGRVPHSGTE